MDSTPQFPRPRALYSLRLVVVGLLMWGWALFMGGLYLDTHPLRLHRWGQATIFSPGPWRFPAAQAGGVALAGAVVVLAWALGRGAGARLRLWRGRPGEHAAATLAGLVLLGMGVFVLGVVGCLRPPCLIGLLIASAGAAMALSPENPRWKVFCFSAPRGFVPRGLAWIPAAIGLLALVVSFAAALAPAVESDGLRYHLFGPQEYLRAGRIHYIPHSAFTNFPFLVEMLFALGLGLGNDVAAKLLHWVHLPLCASLIAALVRRMGGKGIAADFGSRLAAALFLSTPVAAIVAGWSFIDLAITACFLGMILSLSWILEPEAPTPATEHASSEPGHELHKAAGESDGAESGSGEARRESGVAKGNSGRAGLVAVGFFAGAAIGAKYTMLVPAAMAGVVLFFRAPGSLRDRLRRVLLFSLAAALLAGPWFAKNLVLTGNPVYPLAYGVFGGGDWSAEAAQFYSAKAKEKGAQRGGAADFVGAPFDTAFYWVQFEAQNPGPGYLLAFPFLAGWAVWRCRARRKTESGDENLHNEDGRCAVCLVVLFAVVTGLVFFAGYKSNRFLLPIWALGAALAGGFVSDRPSKVFYIPKNAWALVHPQPLLALAILLSSLYGLHWTARFLAAEQSPPPLPAALGFVSREQYLADALSYYPAVEWLGIHAREDEKVFYIGEYHGYPSRIPAAVSDWFDVPLILERIRQTPDNDTLLDQLLEERFRFILINFGELRGYGHRYLRPRFTAGQWERFEELRQSPRLRPRFKQGGTVIYEIRK